MNRRLFLHLSGMSGAALLAPTLPAQEQAAGTKSAGPDTGTRPAPSDNTPAPRPYTGPAPTAADNDLAALTLTDAAARIRARTVTSRQLTEACLDRIRTYNPKVNAFITVMESLALAEADGCDRDAAAGRFRGPLHGLPLALKDNIDTAGTRTTAGSQVFDDRVPDSDADVVSRLKAAGAVLLGKCNMHEFANGRTSVSTYFGPVRNPWALDRIPAGSSGGSAAAVSANLCYAALGTDTGGSVRMPASYCSIVGLKPTYGLVSIRGIVPLTYSLDHCGPMTRTVEDAALLLNSMTGYDKHDVSSVERPREDYVLSMKKQDLKKIRLGVPRAPFFDRLNPEIEDAANAAIEVLVKLTAGPAVDCHLPGVAGFNALALGGEREAYHLGLYRRNAGRYSLAIHNSLEGSIRGMNDTSTEPCSEKVIDYITSQWELIRLRKTIDDSFTDFDVVVMPTMRILPRSVNDSLSREEDTTQKHEPEETSNTAAFDVYGLPAISIPCGFSKSGLPIGLQMAGPRFSEARLLALAAAFQGATEFHKRQPPLTPSTPVPPIKRKD